MSRRIVIAVTGGSGMPYAQRLLAVLRDKEMETHVIISDAARLVLSHEMERGEGFFDNLAYALYSQRDLAAPPASGSWRHMGMVVCPCSMASLAAISSGLGNNLIHRAADVALKERRKLVLVPPRDAALHHTPGEHAQGFPGRSGDSPRLPGLLSSPPKRARPR